VANYLAKSLAIEQMNRRAGLVTANHVDIIASTGAPTYIKHRIPALFADVIVHFTNSQA